MSSKAITLVLTLLICPAGLWAVQPLSLTDAIQMALNHNSELKSIQHDSAAAVFEYEAARSLRLPTLSLEAKSYYVDDVQSFQLPLPTTPAQQLEMGAKENYQADLTLSLPLFTGGRISRTIDIAAARSQAESFQVEAERMNVAYLCRRAYLNILLSSSLAEISHSSVKRLEIINRDVNHLYDNGLADSVDILDAAQALENGKDMLDRQESNQANAYVTLSRIIGLDSFLIPDDTIVMPDELNLSHQRPEIGRAELKRLDHLIKAADRTAELTRSSYYPSLNAFGGYSVGKPNRDMFDKEWDDYFRIGLSLNWKFDIGGTTGKQTAAAKQAAWSTRMAREDLKDDLHLQYTISLINLEQAFRSIKATETEYDLARRKFGLAGDKQKQGQLSVNRLLEMEEDLTAAELRFRVSIISYYLAETDYFYALGSPKIYGGLQ